MYKIDQLLKLDQKLFHTGDLAILWGIESKNTLYTTIKRYVQKGILIPIHKGLYATRSLKKIDSIALGRAVIHDYAYVSCEYELSRAGLINQIVQPITFVSRKTQKFKIGDQGYIVRKLADKYLFNPAGLGTVERAVADMLYFTPKYYFDAYEMIDWKKVKLIQQEVGYK